MKKKLIMILFVLFIFLTNIKAVSVMMNPEDISPRSYVIGTHLFLRDEKLNAIYDGKLTTPRLMIAAKTIYSDDQDEQIVYYKKADGTWIDALTGEAIGISNTVEITKINLLDPEEVVVYATFVDGTTFASKLRALASSQDEINENIVEIARTDELPNLEFTDDNVLSTDDSQEVVYGWYDAGTIYYYSEAEEIYLNEDSSYMFYNLRALESIDSDDFNFKLVTNMEGMFKNCTNLVRVTVDSEGAANVVNVSYMFAGASSMKNLNISGFSGENVTDMSYMFAGASSMESLSLTGFIGEKVTNMSHMFEGCVKLKDLYLDEIDTSEVLNMDAMFKDCKKLDYLDLSNFDFSKASVNNIFDGMTSLRELITPKNAVSNSITLPRELFDENMNAYQSLSASTPTEEKLIAIATFLPGTSFNEKIKSLASNSSVLYTTVNNNIEYIERANELPSGMTTSNIVSTNDSSNPIYAWFDEDTLYYYSNVVTFFLPSDASYMFYRLHRVMNIELNDIDTRNTENMAMMFGECEDLEWLDVTGFDTKNVENMNAMFYSCRSLNTLNVGNFDTSKVTNMASMFAYCSNLSGLNVNYFDTTSVTNMEAMFYNCSKISEIDLSEFDTSSVTNINNMFAGCSRMTSLDISSFDLSAVTTANSVFANMSSLEELITPKVNSNKKINLIAVMQDQNSNIYGALTNTTPTETSFIALTTFLSGKEFNEKLKVLAGHENATYGTIDTNIVSFERVSSIPAGMTFTDENIVSAANSPKPIYAWYSNGTVSYYSEEEKIYLNGDSSYMFANLNGLTSLDLSDFDMVAVLSANEMLSKLPALEELVTPRVNANIEIALANTMYLEGNTSGISSLTNTLPSQTILKNIEW